MHIIIHDDDDARELRELVEQNPDAWPQIVPGARRDESYEGIPVWVVLGDLEVFAEARRSPDSPLTIEDSDGGVTMGGE